jgi:hypothetical protein
VIWENSTDGENILSRKAQKSAVEIGKEKLASKRLNNCVGQTAGLAWQCQACQRNKTRTLMQINPNIKSPKPALSQRRRFQSFNHTRQPALAGAGETKPDEAATGVKDWLSAAPEEYLGRQGQPDGE